VNRTCGTFEKKATHMRGVRIRDLAEGKYLAFDLKEILHCLGPRARKSDWLCSVEECIGHGDTDTLEASFNSGTRIPGTRFSALANQTRQIVDGVFQAFDPGASSPWVRVEAIDSSYWEVFSDDPKILSMISNAFKDVEPIIDQAG
jgi:hypothetical protein